MEFEGKNIVIAGASSGIGLALVTHLQQQGASLCAIGRRADLPAGLSGSGIKYISADLSQPTTDALASQLPEVVHGLVYCPGSITLKPLGRLTEADFLSDYQINVIGAFRLIQLLEKALKKEGGSVVLFSTVAAAVGMGFHASISAAKAGLEAMGRSLASELAAYDVRVNMIAPSLTDTPLAGQLLSTPEKREAATKRHPLKQVGDPAQMAAMAAFLLSAQARWITGQTIGIDGGMASLR